MLEQDAVDGELSTLDIVQKSKKSKKQKHQEESWMYLGHLHLAFETLVSGVSCARYFLR